MNIKQAEEFGSMMGKQAAEQYYGGPSNKVGTLPSASTQIRLPFSENMSPGAIDNFMRTNYSNVDSLGYSRLKFHNDLSSQLNYNGPKQSPTGAGVSRSQLINNNAKGDMWGPWNKRMGEIADQVSKEAPIRHIHWTGEADPRGQKTGPHMSYMPQAAQDTYQKAFGSSSNYSPNQNSRMPYMYVPSVENDTVLSSFPKSFKNQNSIRAHEATHAGWQDDSKASVYSIMPASEAGAVFNEIGQGARAYKDVTGKPLQGSYKFAPQVQMDYRELGDLAKKYRPTDLNSPAGQLFMKRILENSNQSSDVNLTE